MVEKAVNESLQIALKSKILPPRNFNSNSRKRYAHQLGKAQS